MTGPEPPAASGRDVVVLCVGNTYRGDDGVGWAVADALEPRLPEARVVRLDGEPTRLIDEWRGADLAVVVDAVTTGAAAGTVHHVHLDERGHPLATPGSSHALGVEVAAQLGAAVGRLPRRLLLVGIEGVDFDVGDTLTPEVAAAVERATQLVLELVRSGPRPAPG